MLHEVRRPLLDEARQSPNLLSDLAGLEQYIAESYNARSLPELLQNADDAGANRFKVLLVGDMLFAANDGRAFTRDDFESLCRSARSSKTRGESIGYRGIGFKSVVSFTRRVHLVSGSLEASFSRERTLQEVPSAQRAPLVRIPHPMAASDRKNFEPELRRLRGEGHNAVFVFEELFGTNIEEEARSFDPTSLLFLRNIQRVELNCGVDETFTAERIEKDSRTHSIRLSTSAGDTSWLVVKHGDLALAFAQDSSGVCKLKEEDAVVHAFLPTEDPAGLPLKINGDFSTDPSRRHLILDERTKASIAEVSRLALWVIREGLMGSAIEFNRPGLLSAFVPFTDPRLSALRRRTFTVDLFEAMRGLAKDSFAKLKCRPTWLNALDFQKLARASGLVTLDRKLDQIEGLSGFLRFLGASEATIGDLARGLAQEAPSVHGCADLVSYLVSRHATKQTSPEDIGHAWRIWPVGEEALSLTDASSSQGTLDQRFLDMVCERIGSARELERLLEDLVDRRTAARLLANMTSASSPTHAPGYRGAVMDTQILVPDRGVSASPSVSSLQLGSLSLKRWRSAEQQVHDLLNSLGYEVSDVGRQNLGYDLEGKDPQGRPVFIEVKSVEFGGQPLALTANEEATARQKKDSYFIAVVVQTSSALEVGLIRDPATSLSWVKRVRQWVWECTSYGYEPIRVPLE